MGLDERGMQPFRMNGDAVICNGELYGFRPLRDRLLAKYELNSQSDCEILLPLYHEYGVEMFKTLDAELGHEEGGLAHAKAGSSLRSLPGNS